MQDYQLSIEDHLAELAVEMEERFVVWEEDLTTGNGDGVLGTEEQEDQQ